MQNPKLKTLNPPNFRKKNLISALIILKIIVPKSIIFAHPILQGKKKSRKIFKQMCNIRDQMVKTCVTKIM
jgi:hypothetical protein